MTLPYHTIKSVGRFLGLDINRTGHLEKWVSSLGGLTGIFAIGLISQHYFELQNAAWLVASMGASAVLVFAVPHGPLSQPWAVIGGHLVSAVIGVACARWFPGAALAPAAAVALAIGGMHYLRCIHPPGGATALTAVVGGSQLQALGFQYVFTPVLLNAVSLVLIAIAFNYAFRWRRYPASLGSGRKPANRSVTGERLSETELEKALQAMNSIIDISGRDLADIYHLALQNTSTDSLNPEQLELGRCYSNGLYGTDWQVRQIIDMGDSRSSPDDLLIYKIVAGNNRRTTGTASFGDFAGWASYEVYLNENSWQRTGFSETTEHSPRQPAEVIHDQLRYKKVAA